ncbi:MAG: hypothetical protein WCC95_06295 [Candidatus Sulfotelmatobacter sp.]
MAHKTEERACFLFVGTIIIEAAKKMAPSRSHLAIPNEDVLAEFGLTSQDFERMGHTPLKPKGSDQ